MAKPFDSEVMYRAILGMLGRSMEARQKELKNMLRPVFSGNQIKTGVYLLEQKGWIKFPDDRDYSYMRITKEGFGQYRKYAGELQQKRRAG